MKRWKLYFYLISAFVTGYLFFYVIKYIELWLKLQYLVARGSL